MVFFDASILYIFFLVKFAVPIQNVSYKKLFIFSNKAISNGNRTEWSPIRSVIIRVITKSDDRAAGVRFVYHEFYYLFRLSWVLLQINHKNYNFREKKNRKLSDNGKICIKKTDKGCINVGVRTLFLWWLKPWLWLVDLNYKFKCY